MGRFFAAIGRFKMEWFLSAAFLQGGKIENNESPAGNWGLAYCHGNRLETVRMHHKKTESSVPNLASLKEIKTDMALAYQHHPAELLTPFQVQPLVRREKGENWAFCYAGLLNHPKKMFPNWQKIPDGVSAGELLFVFVFDHFRVDNPVESLTELWKQIPDERELAFCLLTARMMVIFCQLDTRNDNQARLWLGQGELLRVICSGSIPDLPDIVWEKLPEEHVIYIQRERWAVV